MCGLIGIVSDTPIADRGWLTRGCSALAHRGPDGTGLWWSTDGCTGLGHRRLAIIDLSAQGGQPMASRCGRYVIVFNGEIYNHLELRAELTGRGFAFAGQSDTEVLLASYQCWGAHCLLRLNGMFAFAIWDAGTPDQAPNLFFARDRVGKKPLYLRRCGHVLRFASELKGLGPVSALDLRALNHYLALGYVPGDQCIAAGVNKLPPAHAGCFVPATGKLHTWRYWSLPTSPEPTMPDSAPALQTLVARTAECLTAAVQVRLRSDVPVGVLLSGGLDSSMVATTAARLSDSTILTFTAAFPGTTLDESGFAALVARRLGIRHHVLEIETPSLAALDAFSALVDEPLADSSLVPTYLITRYAAAHVKVVLGGDGGDELFGGYGHYRTGLRDARLLGWMGRPPLAIAGHLAGYLPAGVKGRARLYGLRRGAGQSQVWGSVYFDAALRTRILSPAALASLGTQLLEPEGWLSAAGDGVPDPVARMTRTDFLTQLPDAYLVKLDRAGMANGLEIRSPLLDYRLVELAFGSIPSRLKARPGAGRILQRALARTLLPPDLDLGRKQGFSIPLDNWLRSSRCREVEELRPWLPEPISTQEVGRLIRGHLRGRANGARLFCLIMLALACRNAAQAA